uniref:Uncharacterized protein n=1 Tax=Oryza punctata TaxID=4537 RepID=A0A0E0LM69_ORYPU
MGVVVLPSLPPLRLRMSIKLGKMKSADRGVITPVGGEGRGTAVVAGEGASEGSRNAVGGEGHRWRRSGAGRLGGASTASAAEAEGGGIMDPRGKGSGSGERGTLTAEALHERERNSSRSSGGSSGVRRPRWCGGGGGTAVVAGEGASEGSRNAVGGEGHRWRRSGAGRLGGASTASAAEAEGGGIMDPRGKGSGSGERGTLTAEALHERERNSSRSSGGSSGVRRPRWCGGVFGEVRRSGGGSGQWRQRTPTDGTPTTGTKFASASPVLTPSTTPGGKMSSAL